MTARATGPRRPTGWRVGLMGGVPGVRPAKVVVIGGGVVGTHAARMAAGLGAEVSIIDRSLPRLRQLDLTHPAHKQHDADVVFKASDLVADRRRGHTEFGCRPFEAGMPGRAFECAQRAERRQTSVHIPPLMGTGIMDTNDLSSSMG